MTGQNDWQDRSLTGQVRDQAGHCPLTGRYLQPCNQRKTKQDNTYGTRRKSKKECCIIKAESHTNGKDFLWSLETKSMYLPQVKPSAYSFPAIIKGNCIS